MDCKLAKENGIVKVDIDGKLYEGLSFKSFRATKRNISDFYSAGIRLMSVLTSGITCAYGVPYTLFGESWIGDGEYDFTPVDRQLDLFSENAPEAYFALMFQVDTRDWWLKENEGTVSSFWNLSQMAGYEKWRREALAYTEALIRHTEEKYGSRIYGYFILGGNTTEWFSVMDHGEGHPCKIDSYRKYLGDSSAEIPSFDVREHTSNGILRSPVCDKEAIEYWKYHHTLISDTILIFADKVKSITEHKKLVGLYFGYIFELGGSRLLDEGHLEYDHIFSSDSIDIISSPSSYMMRTHSDTSGYMVPVDSLALHNKLYYLEFDHRTYLVPSEIEGFNPLNAGQLKTEDETLDVMRRDFMLCASKGIGIWWFDMFEGWFYSKSMMDEISHIINISRDIGRIAMNSCAEIAVFAGSESMYYADKKSGLNSELLCCARRGLARMGAPYDMFSSSDLGSDKINYAQYRLFIFLDELHMSSSEKDFINKNIKSNGNTVCFMYAPNYISHISDDGFSIESMNEMTGMPLAKLSADIGQKFTPCFYPVEYDGVLEFFPNGTTPCTAYKNNVNYTAVFSSEGNLNENTLRDILYLAGVHIWCKSGNPVYVNNHLCGVYHDRNESLELIFPHDCTVTDLFSGEKYQTKNQKLVFYDNIGKCRLLFY